MSERKGTTADADWAADSARSDELAASGPPQYVHEVLQARISRSRPPPDLASPGPPPSPLPPTVRMPSAQRVGEDARQAPPEARPREPAEEPAPSTRRSRRLGKYQFIATLGRGGMADVHLAVSVGPAGFSKLQVIKRLRPAIADEPEFRNMLLDEARLAARLNHRNVVQTNEVGLADGEYFLAMEYLDGQPLSRLLSRAREHDRSIPLALALWILSEVLAGLHYAHELVDYDGSPLNVVHRDVSPHNIFITYDGQVKIVDFGIALAARRVVETRAGTLKGKIAYMAPEQAFSPSSEIDRRADIFSVGVILWEMITGRRLWRGLTDPQIISRLLRDIPDVRTARPDAPFELARICNQALASAPDQRYATAAELRSELDRYGERMGEQVTAQQVGELVSELFASERAEIRAIIDRQLKKLRELSPDELMAEPEPVVGGSSLPSLPPRAPYESYTEEASTTAPSVSSGRVSTPPQGTLHAVVRPEPARPRSRLPLMILAVVGVAALGLATLYLQFSRPRGQESAVAEPHATAAPVATAAASATTAPVAPAVIDTRATEGAFIRAHIKVNPVDAKILIDGSELPSNPFEGKFIKDGAAHRIEMQAPGFIAQRRMLVFDNDIDLDVVLYAPQKTPAPAVTAGGVTMPPPKPDPY